MAGGLSCRVFEAGGSRFHAARISIFGQSVQIDPEEPGIGGFQLTIRDLSIDRPVAGLPLRIYLPDGRNVEVDETESFIALVEQADGKSSKALRAGQFSLRAWVAVIFLTITLPIGAWFTYPIAADAIALSLPDGVDRTIGKNVLAQMDKLLFEESMLSDTEKAEYRALFEEVRLASGMPEGTVSLRFRKSDSFGANALAFPDGTVLLLDDLIELAENEDELASVIAHEIAHVEKRHAIRRTVRAVGLTVFVSFILGDSVALIEELAAAGLFVTELAYSREFEIEADTRAGEIMREMGRDPIALVDLLRRIMASCGAECDETSFFPTHPGLKDRLEVLQ